MDVVRSANWRGPGAIARTSSRVKAGGEVPGRCCSPTRQDASMQVPLGYPKRTSSYCMSARLAA
eukprot:8869019-Alexandrium_andersonii.AAC.1